MHSLFATTHCVVFFFLPRRDLKYNVKITAVVVSGFSLFCYGNLQHIITLYRWCCFCVQKGRGLAFQKNDRVLRTRCIPVGCIPPASVVVSPACTPPTPPCMCPPPTMHASYYACTLAIHAPPPRIHRPATHAPPPPWTEWLTHASENITLPQTSFVGDN